MSNKRCPTLDKRIRVSDVQSHLSERLQPDRPHLRLQGRQQPCSGFLRMQVLSRLLRHTK